jgi:hypothetical protein
MNNSHLKNLIIKEAGPILRYRCLRELCGQTRGREINNLKKIICNSNEYKLWMKRLKKCIHMHGGNNDRFENIVGKLTEMGIDRSFNDFHQNMKKFLGLLDKWAKPKEGMFPTLKKTILTMGLARTGYYENKAVVEAINSRLIEVHRVIKAGSYNIYISRNKEPKKPDHFSKYQILSRKFCPMGNVLLPYIYDLYAVGAVPRSLYTAKQKGMINDIIGYIFQSKYQKLPDGYGIAIDDSDGVTKFYKIGWNVHLPGFFGKELTDRDKMIYLMRLELFARFNKSRNSDWYRKMIRHSESYRNEDGTYLFPPKYLIQRKEGYWITGNHMGIESDRTNKRIKMFESTFRMLKIAESIYNQ